MSVGPRCLVVVLPSLSHCPLSLTTSGTSTSQLTLLDLEIPASITRNEVYGFVAVSTPLRQSRLSASETPSEEGDGHAWESDEWFGQLN